MATPGVGTIVRFHYSGVDSDFSETIYGDIPATVWVTHDSWNSTFHDEWGITQPSASDVLLYVVLPHSGNQLADPFFVVASEGSSAGEFSLIQSHVLVSTFATDI